MENKETIIRNAEKYCEQLGVRLTPIRKQVLSIILDYKGTIKAYDILNELKKSKKNATPPTVYRAIDFFVDIGLLHRAESLNAFLFCHQFNKQHISIITNCKYCQQTQEIIDEYFTDQLQDLTSKNNLILSDEPIVISVVCKNCAKGNKNEHK